MATMGRYCKAYSVEQFRAFPGWQERLDDLAPAENDEDGTTEPRTSLGADDYLFLHETLVVTDGIFLDEHIVFDQVTPEWTEFCTRELAFEVPDYARGDDLPATPEPDSAAAPAAASATAPVAATATANQTA